MPGHIEKRGANSYRLIVSNGYDSKGKQLLYRKTVKAKDEKEAEKLLALYIAEVETGIAALTKNIKLKDFIDLWLKNHVDRNLAPKTAFRYRQLVDDYIIPALGHLKLDKIRPNHLLEFYGNLAEDGIRRDGKEGGLSDRTILHNHRTLHTILETAVQWQYIPSNPAARVKAPTVAKKKKAVYDDDQTANLVEALKDEPLRNQAVVILTLASGTRIGEVLGLTWDKVDFKKNEIDIDKAYQYVPGKGRFEKAPKNESSRRKLAVPKWIMDLLKQWKAEQSEQKLALGEKWIDKTNAVFTSYLGTRLPPGTVSRWFSDFIKKKKLPPLTFHGLRHTAASLLIAYGASAPEVAEMLGHSTPGTTINIYAHAFEKSKKTLANTLGNMIKKGRK